MGCQAHTSSGCKHRLWASNSRKRRAAPPREHPRSQSPSTCAHPGAGPIARSLTRAHGCVASRSVDKLGNEGLYKLLDGHENKQGYCECVLAFSAGPGAEPILWTGRCNGTIVSPRGTGGFGWDSIFIPEGEQGPFGEMPLEEKNEISHRARALEQFVEHFRSNEEAIFDAIDGAAPAF